jgi:hypothetical protein
MNQPLQIRGRGLPSVQPLVSFPCLPVLNNLSHERFRCHVAVSGGAALMHGGLATAEQLNLIAMRYLIRAGGGGGALVRTTPATESLVGTTLVTHARTASENVDSLRMCDHEGGGYHLRQTVGL